MSRTKWIIGAFGAAVCLAAMALCADRVLYPVVWHDDFHILERSWTWEKTRASLWEPTNEHLMPLGRLTTRLLVMLAGGRLTAVPLVTGLQGLVALLAALVLLYRFVRRETGRPFAGLLAMTLFGVTLTYYQAVAWFSASFSLLALDTFLLALLAAQRWRQTGARLQLFLCIFWVTLAPFCFAIGILAGPLCAVYLLPQDVRYRKGTAEQLPAAEAPIRPARRGRVPALAPLAGTLAFVAVALPLMWEPVVQRLHRDGRSELLQAVGGATPGRSMAWIAWTYTGRALVDGPILYTLGLNGKSCSPSEAAAVLAVLAVAGAWWCLRGRQRRLPLLGLAIILLSYLLIFAARAHIPYEVLARWTRYHLFAQLGLALFVCGGLRARAGTEGLTWKEGWVIAALVGLAFNGQWPHAWNYWTAAHWRCQQAYLAHVEAVDRRCRELHLGGDLAPRAARLAFPDFEIPYAGPGVSPWTFLRGSDCPEERTVEEAARLLGEQSPKKSEARNPNSETKAKPKYPNPKLGAPSVCSGRLQPVCSPQTR